MKLRTTGLVITAVCALGILLYVQSESVPYKVQAYCNYGAVSDDQWQGCVDHVTERRIDQLDTNAARFARGELPGCLDDAGPFCREWVVDGAEPHP